MQRLISPILFVFFLLSMGCLAGFGHHSVSAEEVYSYVDAEGVIHFTNVPTDRRYKQVESVGRSSVRPMRLKPRMISPALHQEILFQSNQYQMDPALVQAVIHAESAYDPGALSSKGAMGLMQLMPSTASLLNVSNPYNPSENISGGVRYLRYLLDRFNGNIPLAVAAYNAGEHRVERDRGIPRISETREYVRRVLSLYRIFSQTSGETTKFKKIPLKTRSRSSRYYAKSSK